MIAQNKIDALIRERDEVLGIFKTLAEQYRYLVDEDYMVHPNMVINPNYVRNTISIPISLIRKLNEKIARIRALNHRIATLGQKYLLVQVTGKVYALTGSIKVAKSYKIIYTDISEYDALRKVQLLYSSNLIDSKTEVIPCGVNIETSFFKA